MNLFILNLVLNIITTAFMTGVIWLVQIVNYPLYIHIHEENFNKYQTEHIERITPLVAPIMIVELFTSLGLISFLPTELAQESLLFPLLVNFVLVIFVWLSTVSYSVPTHQALKEAWDQDLYCKLINTNWTRTIAWTLKLAVCSYTLYKLLTSIVM